METYTKIPMTFGMKLDTRVTRPLKIILTMHKRYCSVADQQRARPIGQVYVLHTAIDFVDYIAYVCLLTPIEFGISRLF